MPLRQSESPVGYIRLNDHHYPVTEQDIRDAHPSTSFCRPFVAPEQYAPVFAAVQPAFDPIIKGVREIQPVLESGDMVQCWELFDLLPEQIAAHLAAAIAAAVQKIDADADAIYTAALGNRATEYAQAEADATVYKDAGYAGSVPGCVQAWATATGKAAHWAADDILATAQGWRDAQAQIRLNRLSRKELARKATTAAELDTVRTQWAAFVVAIRSQLRI